jgi:hypothetical protein
VELLINDKVMSELASHLEHVVDLFDEVSRVFLCEMVVIRLQHEELVDLWTLIEEKATDFLGLRVFLEELLVLALLAEFGVVSH